MSYKYQVYLSSTRKDLEAERSAVEEALAGKCIVKQSYGASESDLIATCLDDVAACDMYIGIVGLRYGYCPVDAAKNPAGKSITELEYEQAIAKGVPRYVFVKDESSTFVPHTDSHTKENGAGDRIREFRDRLGNGKEQVPALFAAGDDLRWKVIEAFFSFKTRREGGGASMQGGRRLAAEVDRDVALAFVPGTDDLDYRSVTGLLTPSGGEDRRFRSFTISPDDPAYLLSLDPPLRCSRAVCWALTPASLSRYRQQPQLLVDVLVRVRRQGSAAFALLQGVESAELDPAWRFDATLAVGAGQLQVQTAHTLDSLYRHVREHSQALGQDRRVAVPWVVIALKASEAGELAAKTDQVMGGFKPAQRIVWRDQFERLRKALVATTGKSWPEDFYGDARAAWKPFGQGGHDIATQLADVVAGINGERQAGSRESRLLGDAALHLQPYDFDDYIDDRLSSRATLAGLKDRGCVVLVDEFALLHPALRAHAETFLTTQRAALVSANPTDPAWCSVEELLDDFSFLRVGSLFERFDKIGDPRCELALNSPRRLARWLRMILPEMVNTLGTGESDPGLVGRADQLLG